MDNEVIHNNIVRIKDHSQETRVIVRELEKQVNESKLLILSQNEIIELLKTQIQQLQVKLYTGGAVSP